NHPPLSFESEKRSANASIARHPIRTRARTRKRTRTRARFFSASLALAQLGQDSAHALGVHERDLRAARADLRRLVDHRSALRLQRRDRRLDVVDLDADVVQPLATLLEELRHAAVGG